MNTENNKLIAEFMGLNLYRENWYKSTIGTEKKICKENDLQYHSDWNWLMEVVEKIERYCYDEIDTEFKIDIFAGASIFIPKSKDREKMPIHFDYINNPKIQAVYNACVEFIKWYNTEKQVSR